MSRTFQNALSISGNEVEGSRLNLARSILSEEGEMVIVDGRVALWSKQMSIICEVIHSQSLRGGTEVYQIELKDAKEFLKNTTIWSFIEDKNLEWIVVADTGMGRIKVWPEK